MLKALRDLKARYDATFDQVSSLIVKEHKLVDTDMNRKGAEVERNLTAVAEGFRLATDMEGVSLVSSARRHFLLGRLQLNKFLLQAVADGDLTRQAEVTADHELGQMGQPVERRLERRRPGERQHRHGGEQHRGDEREHQRHLEERGRGGRRAGVAFGVKTGWMANERRTS